MTFCTFNVTTTTIFRATKAAPSGVLRYIIKFQVQISFKTIFTNSVRTSSTKGKIKIFR